MGVFAIMYLVLVILMFRSFLNEVYLIIFSYIVLASFFGIEVTHFNHYTVKKSAIFPSPAGMSLTKLSLGRNS
jgi:hypothetical protein